MSPSGALQYMAQALQFAERGRYTTFPNPRVGCVIVRDDEVVGRGWHERAGQAHAEVMALGEAGERARGADLYVTLEPCSHHGRTPPCADAVLAAGVRRVVAAMADPNPLVAGKGLERLRAAGLSVEVGVLEAAARELNRGFVSRMARGRPYVTLKLAASLDGRTAMASGESQWITSPAARRDVHRLRAEAGAVLTGAGTVLADDPQLNVRDVEGASRPPDRIVLDSAGRVPASARVWSNADGARLFHITTADAGAAADGRVDLAAALALLARQEVNHVLVECGRVLAGAFLDAGLVDELICYVAPSVLGDAARGLASVPGLERLEQRVQLRFTDVRSVGPDLRITAIPQPRSA